MKEESGQALRSLAPALGVEWGLVLGSGLATLADCATVAGTFRYEDFPELPRSRVEGHAGRYAIVRFSGVPVLVAQGRVHLYEGRTAQEVTAGIRLIAACGVKRLILTNAAGTLNPQFPPGDWMMLSDHLNLTGTSPLIGGPNFIDMSTVYSATLRSRLMAAARAENLLLHEGVYAGVIGPQYETPAEIRMLATLGADAVGMSTVLEAIQARALGMEVAGLSCLTNWAAGLSPQPLSHQEVLERGKSAAAKLSGVLQRVFTKAPSK